MYNAAHVRTEMNAAEIAAARNVIHTLRQMQQSGGHTCTPTLTVDMHSHDSCINDERQLASNGEAGNGGLSSRVTELTAISAKCSAEGHR